jgi:uncharacterized membrane protein YqjE
LPKAAPILARQAAAYLQLAGEDLARVKGALATQFIVAGVVAISVLIVLLMTCLAVVALTWDTPHRLTAIVSMGGGALVIGGLALWYGARVTARRPELFSLIRREWQNDRVILNRVLEPDAPNPEVLGPEDHS